MSNGTPEEGLQCWTVVPLSLMEVASILESALDLVDVAPDAENVSEWVTARTRDDRVHFNLSRPHEEGEPLFDEPVSILVNTSGGSDGEDELDIDALARRIASALGVPVSVGYCEYLGGEDFAYEELRRHDP